MRKISKLPKKQYVHIDFYPKSGKQWQELLQLETALKDWGITFDTGTAFTKPPRHEWELDFSLRGASPHVVLAVIRKHVKSIKHKITKGDN